MFLKPPRRKNSSMRMIRSGIVPIDEACDGIRPRATYLLTGGAGAGKTLSCLQFIDQGLRSGENVLMLTHARRQDLLASAEQLGIDLRVPLREERAVILRYRSDFTRRLTRAGSGDHVLDELRGLITKYRPRRIVIDTISPLLDDGSASPASSSALAEVLERSEATALLTYPADLGGGYDRRLEPLVQAATGVFRLTRDTSGTRTIEVVSLRYPATRSRASFAPPEQPVAPSADESLTDATGPLQFVHVAETPAEDLLATLRLQHQVNVHDTTLAHESTESHAALIVEADHTSLDRARALVRSNAAKAVPIVVVSRFNLRSLDRARLLREGADEVLAGDMGAPELLQRLATTLRRGHLVRPPHAVHEDEALTHAALAPAGELLDPERFRAALQARSAHDDAVPFTVARLTTDNAGAAEHRQLGTLVLGVMRVGSGDLAALLDEGVAVYLHGAGRREVAPFLDRLRARRPVGAPALRVEAASFPADGAAVRQLVEPLEVR